MKHILLAVSLAASASAFGYRFSSDFFVVDASGAPYCIDVERNTRFSHGHAYIDNGRYAIPVNANRHFLATPKLRDFRLEADFSQTEIRPHDTGLTVWFRDDRTGRTGHKLVAYWDFFSKFFIYLDGKEIYSRQDETIPDLSDSHLVIDVRGSTATAELYGTKVEFSLPSNDPAGYIAFDTQFAAAYPTLYSRIEVVSPEEPPKTEIGRWRMQLSKSQGFWKGPEYNVLLERYESGEYLLSAVLSGTEMDRPVTNRIETGGSEWGQILERLECPYVRIIGPDGGEWRRFNFWNGLKTLYDPKMKRADKKLFPDIKWPCSVSYVLRDLPADFIVAAGYDMAMQRPYSFLGNGPYEQMCARNGAFLHEGERVDAGRFAVSLASPPDKKMARMIPKTVYDYPAALKHAQKGHYFFESEPVSFTAETRWRAADFVADEVKCAFRATDVYGDAFDGDDVDVEPLGADEMLCGIVCRRHKVTMPKTPSCGVWKLVAECGAAGAWTNKSVTIFEVLSDDPNGPCPPLASRLPEFVSMPNETKYLETDAFDPWSDGWGASHYYTTINRYPTIAEMTRIWELLPLYRRRWFCWSWSRNMDLKDIRDERNRELIRHCDVFGGEENGTPPQGYEFQSYKEYTGLKLGILRDYIDARHPPLKVLTRARLDDPEVENKGIKYEEFVDLFDMCWADFVTYARAKADAITENFDKYVHEVNPNAGRGGYGPMNIYVSQYKSPYHLTISQKSVTTNDFLRRNGSFWMFEDYHVSCDYPLLRASYWVAGYDMLYPKGRKIYPEIYTGGWTRCLDGAVFNAHPMSTYNLRPTHLRRLVYRYTYGSPHFTGGRFGYWNDYGWHARNPTLPEMEELVSAWGKMIKNEPKRPTKAPYAIVDIAAYRRHGDYLEDQCNFYSRGDGLIWTNADVDNTAEEGVAYAYEKACQAGYVTPVVTQLSDLDSFTTDGTEFVILPPIVEGTPRDVIDSIRRAHERGIALLASEDVCGLEDVFGVKKDSSGARKVGFFPDDAFDHKLALAKYVPDGATVALFGAKDADSPFDIPIVMMNAPSGKGRTVFVNMPPTVAHRAMFRDNGQKGQDALSEAMSDGYRKAFAFLAPQPAVSTERGTICAAYTEKGDLIVTVEDDSPIYHDPERYPVTFRFAVSVPGIGRMKIDGEADFAVVSRSDDKVVVRTTCQKDTALFFRFCAK